MTERKRKVARTALVAATLLALPITFTEPGNDESLLPKAETSDACGQSQCCLFELGSVCLIDNRPNYHLYTSPDC